jgi:DNA replication licensing factor MCM7
VYACDVCGFEVYQIINTKEFTPKIELPLRRCEQNQTKSMLVMQVKSSKFISYQEIKIQEPSDQVPIGHVPHTMSIIDK